MTPTFALLLPERSLGRFSRSGPAIRVFSAILASYSDFSPDLGRRARLPRLAVRDRASDPLSGRINERRGHRDLQSRRRNARSSAATAILALIPVSASLLAIPVHGEIPTSTGWLAIAAIVLGGLFAARPSPQSLQRASPKR